LPDSDSLKLQLAEYQALTQRSTALIGQMFGVMAVGFAFLGYLINAWPSSTNTWSLLIADEQRQLLSSGLLVEQIIILFWVALRSTELGITLYIETDLRKSCKAAVAAPGDFWGYGASRNTRTSFHTISIWLPTIASIGAFLGVWYYRFAYVPVRWILLEYLAWIASLGLLVWTIFWNIEVSKLKKDATAAQDSITAKLEPPAKGALMPVLTDAEIQQALDSLKGWQRNGKAIQRVFRFPDFKMAMQFVNKVAEAAEQANHHPDIDIRYNTVTMALVSHDSGGVTQRDVRMAGVIDRIGES
jgi:4a-hydroxytetrahydrobiopterin dehydratase